MKLSPIFSSFSYALLVFGAVTIPIFAQEGRIETGQITSAGLANNLFGDPATRDYLVYLPPSYDTSQKRFPVVYFLHGYTGDKTSFLVQLGMQSYLDSMISLREIGEIIAVFVDGSNRLSGSCYLSSPVIGDYETYIATDLVKQIDSRYRTLAARESRSITGLSMGGWGAMHLALKFPATFSITVPQAGYYDATGAFTYGSARQLALKHPTNLMEFDSLLSPSLFLAAAHQALCCGLLPNPQRPDLYSDYIYEWTNGQPVFNESTRHRCLDGDVQHGDVSRYLQQPIRLSAIKIIHGTADTLVPIIEARNFTNVLATAGIDFTYEEHSGGHEYVADLALPFISAHLKGAEMFIVAPRLSLAYTSDTIRLSFPSEPGIEYTIESSASSSGINNLWTAEARLIGDGRTIVRSLPTEKVGRFFRLTAANHPTVLETSDL